MVTGRGIIFICSAATPKKNFLDLPHPVCGGIMHNVIIYAFSYMSIRVGFIAVFFSVCLKHKKNKLPCFKVLSSFSIGSIIYNCE